MWDLILRAARQVRPAFGGVPGLDLGAVMVMGAALGLPALLMAEVLPEIEGAVVAAYNRGGSE